MALRVVCRELVRCRTAVSTPVVSFRHLGASSVATQLYAPVLSKRYFSSTPEEDWPKDATGSAIDPMLCSPKVAGIVDEIVAMNMLEVAMLTNRLKEKLGLTDEMIFNAGGRGGGGGGGGGGGNQTTAAAEVVEQTAFTVKLTGFDASSKIKVIKEVRGATGLGLKEAKELVQGAPRTLMEGLSKAEAEVLCEKLKAAGGETSIE